MWFLQPGITFAEVLMRIFAVLIIIFLAFPLHEYAHALVAYKLGDRTAKSMGRMTLNPLVHFDPIGALMILIFSFGWAKATPVNASNFKNPRRDMLLVSLAGPFSNLLVAIIGGFLVNFMDVFSLGYVCWLIQIFLVYFVSINVTLAVFNMLPIAPLDGFGMIEAFLPQKALEWYYKNYQMISIVMILLLFFGFFSGPIAFLQEVVYDFIMQITAWPFSFFS